MCWHGACKHDFVSVYSMVPCTDLCKLAGESGRAEPILRKGLTHYKLNSEKKHPRPQSKSDKCQEIFVCWQKLKCRRGGVLLSRFSQSFLPTSFCLFRGFLFYPRYTHRSIYRFSSRSLSATTLSLSLILYCCVNSKYNLIFCTEFTEKLQHTAKNMPLTIFFGIFRDRRQISTPTGRAIQCQQGRAAEARV